MLKFKSQIKNLGLIVTLGLLSSTVSATSLYDTTGNTFIDSQGLGIGEWGASRFKLNSTDCPNGCDVSDASLFLFDGEVFFGDTASLNGITLSVYDDGGDGESLGTKLFSFDTGVDIGAGLSTLSFSVQNGENSFVANDTFYWLSLENVSRSNDISWGYSYDGITSDASLFNDGAFYSGEPLFFTLNGTPSVSAVPVPGAVWMMGSGLFGLLAVSRRKPNKQA